MNFKAVGPILRNGYVWARESFANLRWSDIDEDDGEDDDDDDIYGGMVRIVEEQEQLKTK